MVQATLLRLTSKWFVCGVVLHPIVLRAAPIVKYMIGWKREQVEAYCKKRGWKWEEVKDAS